MYRLRFIIQSTATVGFHGDRNGLADQEGTQGGDRQIDGVDRPTLPGKQANDQWTEKEYPGAVLIGDGDGPSEVLSYAHYGLNYIAVLGILCHAKLWFFRNLQGSSPTPKSGHYHGIPREPNLEPT